MDVHIHCTLVKSVLISACIHEQCRRENKRGFFPAVNSGNLSYKLKFSSDKLHRLKGELNYSGGNKFQNNCMSARV